MVEWFLGALGIVAALCIALCLLALYGVESWTRPARARPRDHPHRYGLPCEEVEFTSRDGVRLHGWLIDGSSAGRGDDAKRTVGKSAIIFCHGHGGDKSPDVVYAPWFHERGIPVLMFDFRNHGLSDGVLTSMGYYERYDLLGAIDYLASRGYTRVGLYGFSMGGATAMATAPLSPHVVCVVSDSGFAQLRPTLAHALRRRLLSERFANRFMSVIWRLAERRLRCDLDEAEPLRAVQQFGNRALFIILGTRDKYVETWQAHALHEKASGPKELWVVPKGEHAAIARQHPEEYRARVLGFFERHLALELSRKSAENAMV